MSSVPSTHLDQIVAKEIEKGSEFKLGQNIPLEVSFKNINVWVSNNIGTPCKKKIRNKLLLRNVNGQFKAGTATAIIGSSGAGKTTLLNYISSRMQNSKLNSNGELYINGKSVSSILPIKHRTGFVNQFDILFPELTAREQLLYTAKLSGIPSPVEKVSEIITILGLDRCADTRVGNEVIRGISGGERKRVSIGIELITDPSLLFLDEPTTGLDSKSALDVAGILRTLSDNQRTVITTIHSPSAEILEKFDKLICLCKGEIIYDGPPSKIISYFASLGFPVPPLTNPADHLMQIINDDDVRIKAMEKGEDLTDEVVTQKFQERIEMFVKNCRQSTPLPTIQADMPAPFVEVSAERKTKSGAFANFCFVLQRCLLIYFRNPQSFRTKLIQTVGFAGMSLLLLTKTTDPLENTYQYILDKGGMAFNVSSTMCFAGVFANLYTFIPALPTFRRESQNKLYGPITFFTTHDFFELPFVFVLTAVYLLILFWAINMKHDSFATFIKYLVVFFCIRLSASGLGDFLSIGIKSIEVINQAFPVLVVPLFLVSGFIAVIKSVAWHMKIYSYISFFRFGFEGVINIEFGEADVLYLIENCRIFIPGCPNKEDSACYVKPSLLQAATIPQCNPRSIFDFYHSDTWWVPCLFLLGQAFVFRVLAIIATFQFVKETNVTNDTIPEEFHSEIERTKNIKYSDQNNLFIRNTNSANQLSKQDEQVDEMDEGINIKDVSRPVNVQYAHNNDVAKGGFESERKPLV